MFNIPGKGTNEKEKQVPKSAESAQEELAALFGPESNSPIEEPAAVEPPAPQKKAPKAKAPSAKKDPKTKVPVAGAVISESKLRKAVPDPTAKRVSARIPSGLYADLNHIRATQSLSIDYCITNALQTIIYHKYTCSCGMVFFTDGDCGEPKTCPSCGSSHIRRDKLR